MYMAFLMNLKMNITPIKHKSLEVDVLSGFLSFTLVSHILKKVGSMLLLSIAPKVILFSDPYKFISTNAYAYAMQLPHLQLSPVKTIVYPLSLTTQFYSRFTISHWEQ